MSIRRLNLQAPVVSIVFAVRFSRGRDASVARDFKGNADEKNIYVRQENRIRHDLAVGIRRRPLGQADRRPRLRFSRLRRACQFPWRDGKWNRFAVGGGGRDGAHQADERDHFGPTLSGGLAGQDGSSARCRVGWALYARRRGWRRVPQRVRGLRRAGKGARLAHRRRARGNHADLDADRRDL